LLLINLYPEKRPDAATRIRPRKNSGLPAFVAVLVELFKEAADTDPVVRELFDELA
jgi:hypothetical protein